MRILVLLAAAAFVALITWITLSDSPTEGPPIDRPGEESARTRLAVPAVVPVDPARENPETPSAPAPEDGGPAPAAAPAVENLAPVRGRVVDGEDKGVAGVFVRSSDPARSGHAETAADGSFTLGVAAGKQVLTVAGVGVRSPEGGLEVTAPVDGVVIRVERYRIGTGTVVAEDDGRPVPAATVRMTLSRGGWSQTHVDGRGRFAFDLSDKTYDDPDLRFKILVTATGFADAERADLALGDVVPDAKLVVKLVRDLEVEPGRLTGRVLYDTGDPFHGSLTLSFSREGKAGEIFRIETNEKGEFVVPRVAAGEYALRSAPHGESLLRETGKRLVIPPGGEERTEFTITRGGDVKFSVTGPDGKAMEDVELVVTGDDETEARTFRLGAGEGTIRDVAPGRAKLRFAKDGYAAAETEVTVVKGQTTETSVRMEETR